MSPNTARIAKNTLILYLRQSVITVIILAFLAGCPNAAQDNDCDIPLQECDICAVVQLIKTNHHDLKKQIVNDNIFVISYIDDF